MTTNELTCMAGLALSMLFVLIFFDEGKVVTLNSVYQENFIFPILYYIIKEEFSQMMRKSVTKVV